MSSFSCSPRSPKYCSTCSKCCTCSPYTDSEPSPENGILKNDPCNRYLSARSETISRLKEMFDEESYNKQENKKNKTDLKTPPSHTEKSVSSIISEIHLTPKRRLPKVIPETPPDKLNKKKQIYDEVVKQSPIKQIRFGNRQNTKLANLLRDKEEQRRIIKENFNTPKKKSDKLIISNSINASSAKKILFALHTAPRGPRINLLARFDPNGIQPQNGGRKRPHQNEDDTANGPDNKRVRESFS